MLWTWHPDWEFLPHSLTGGRVLKSQQSLNELQFQRIFTCLRPLLLKGSLVISPDPKKRQVGFVIFKKFVFEAKVPVPFICGQEYKKYPCVQMNTLDFRNSYYTYWLPWIQIVMKAMRTEQCSSMLICIENESPLLSKALWSR